MIYNQCAAIYLQSAIVDATTSGEAIERGEHGALASFGHQSFQLHRPPSAGRVEPDIRATLFAASDVNAMAKTGAAWHRLSGHVHADCAGLGLARGPFLRWIIIGSAVILWSVASGASGLAATFAFALLLTLRLRGDWRRRLRPGGAHGVGRIFFRWPPVAVCWRLLCGHSCG